MNMSVAWGPGKEFAVKAPAGTLHVVCSWEPNVQLQVSVTGAAGHGLPGRIAMFTRSSTSPAEFDLDVTAEQAARGPVYVEINRSYFQQKIQGTVRGKVTVTGGAGAAKADEPTAREQETAAAQEGKLLSLSEVRALESKLASNPNDWTARVSLISYYSSSADLHMSKAEAIAARRRHILWTIKNRASSELFIYPDFQITDRGPLADPEGSHLAADAWRQAIVNYGEDTDVLRNAAAALVDSDPSFIEKLMMKAQAQHPQDARWNAGLAWLYAKALLTEPDSAFAEHARSILMSSDDPDMLDTVASMLGFPVRLGERFDPTKEVRPQRMALAEDLASRAVALDAKNPRRIGPLLYLLDIDIRTAPGSADKSAIADKARDLFQRFNQLDPSPEERGMLLPGVAELAFDIEEQDAAAQYAQQWLQLTSTAPESLGETRTAMAIHDANDLLGRIALRSGNLARAKEYLQKAAATPGSSAMDLFGPRMLLAQELLDRGERQAVIEYLQKTRTFWKTGSPRIDTWIDAIRNGKPVRLNAVQAPFPSTPAR